jgi:integrase
MTDATRRGRKVTGSPIRGADGRWTIRVPVPGTRQTRRHKLPAWCETEERATEIARAMHEKWLAQPELLAAPGDKAPMTVARYLDLWTAERSKRVHSAKHTQRDLQMHVLDDRALASKLATDVTRDDVRAVVTRLNAKVTAGAMLWSTARKVWATTRCMFRSMCDHDDNALRIREDDVTAGISKPHKGVERSSEILYPNEAAKLLACSDVPVPARRLWALLIYTGMRPSELEALEWASVDLEHDEITVHETIDRDEDDGATKETKTGMTRTIDILPALLPLIRAMHAESGGTGRMLPSVYATPARHLRSHLMRSGVGRAALFARSKTQRQITARDLRGTTASWYALCEQMADAGMAVIGRRATGLTARDVLGHSGWTTTEQYYEKGRRLKLDKHGHPFGPLLADLVSGQSDRNSCQTIPQNEAAGESVSSDSDGLDPICRSTGETPRQDVDERNEHENSLIDNRPSDRVEHLSPRLQVKSTGIPAGEWQEFDESETALEETMRLAARAGEWTTVQAIAGLLEARQRAAAGVTDLGVERARRKL